MYKLAEILPKIDLSTLSEDMRENINLIKTLSDDFTTEDKEALEMDELIAPMITVPDSIVSLPKAVEEQEIEESEEVVAVAPKTDDIKGSYYKGVTHKYENQYALNKAIEELLSSKEEFTSDEMEFASQFSGYGGLEKFGAKGVGLLYEFFTPASIVKKMWALAIKHGYKGGEWLEPSVGSGRFIKYSPTPELCTGFEINPVSSKICQLLFPKANIKNQPFEKTFIKGNLSVKHKFYDLPKYELVIGNPPYGDLQGLYFGMGEKEFTKAHNFVEYFITRGLDLLESGGLLVFVIGAEIKNGGRLFLDSGTTPCKEAIAEKSDLVDAYRLPSGLFDNTGVTTEIVVLRKK